ncbi:glycyl-radical enzyme activating protein [Anaerovorax odorimutans]|uniref:Glycyl-radical enzyme activating protein n=1 Tax=Anaerovorax odorimutans TaxID=109327 RepID=A0ABT1RT41_9FIRM|nr:glycyl-radical enzyme activating protein [Anaerovorax odorimutans]MCQ4638289.1 glycyl-radical enzyme activating protein [Anaerovorax odorimutans]
MAREGIIFNIQRYTIHDGPGIRTELFLKGCPLTCRWCGNPESQSQGIVPGVYTAKCIGKDKCGFCETACAEAGSLVFEENKLVSIDRKRCINCMKCADQCPADAIKQWGRKMTAEEAMEVIRRDKAYYQSSQGGVTVSGGEPLTQSEFTADLFERCQKEGIHTCLESTFCTDWSLIERVVPYADLLITDIKHMDPEAHRKHTGVSNERILENLKRLSKLGKEMIVRIPVIPGVNDDMENMRATCDFIIRDLGNRVSQLQLLSFMRLGEEKYASLGRPYPMGDVNLDRKQFNKHIQTLANYFNGRGVSCTAGTTAGEDGGMKE